MENVKQELIVDLNTAVENLNSEIMKAREQGFLIDFSGPSIGRVGGNERLVTLEIYQKVS